jgi:hypothetical protein
VFRNSTNSTRRLRIGAAIGTIIICLCLGRVIVQHSRSHRLEKTRSDAAPASNNIAPPRTSFLHINSVVEHGHIFEIKGTTKPGATVMINGGPTPTIFGGYEFRYFVGPLPSGTTIVSITSQDEQGGVETQQIALTPE